MRIVLDTNVFCVSLSPFSKHAPIFDALISGHFTLPHYHWRLIINDPDDDKFVDLAVAGNANFIVTNDRHFNILSQIPFPAVQILKADEFLDLLAAQ